MLLSIVMPVYNEIDTIQAIIDAVFEEPTEKELIIVDDYSTDGTRDYLHTLDRENIKVFFHEKNVGKGGAVRTGLQHVSGEIVIIQDADLEYSPEEYAKLIKPILADKADVVYGSRFIGPEHRVLFFWHYLGNKFLTLLSNMFTNLNLSDMETCYKAFRREIADRLTIESNRFGMEPEITAKIAKLKCRVYEVPISYYGRDYSEGKKITWRDGFSAMWCIIKYNCFSHGTQKR